ncbi:MAG: ATP-binding protein [Oscillospiraceae bacterium]|nr:ATP-binding protein [Oscillospiraceae bacterium]
MNTKVKRSFSVNMSLLVIAVVGALLIAVFTVKFFTIRNIYIQTFQKQTVNVNDFVVAQINGDKVEEYAASFNKDEYYWELQRMLYRLKSIFNIEYLYILTDNGEAETYTYIFDAIFNDVTQSFDDSQYGKTADKSNFPGSVGVLRDGLPFEEAVFYDNEHERMIYAYAPINNSRGEVVAFLGTEISAEPMFEDINRTVSFLVFFAVISFTVIYLAIMLYSNKYVTKPLVKLSADVTEFSKGNIGIEIPKNLLSRKDELGLIYQSFSNVISTIGNLIDDLRNTTDDAIRGNIDTRINYADNYLGSYKHIAESIDLLMDNTKKIFNLMPVYFSVFDYDFNLLYRNVPIKSLADNEGVSEKEIIKSIARALKASFFRFAESRDDNCTDSLHITLSDNTVRHYDFFLVKNNPRCGVKNICCVLTDVTDYVEMSEKALAASSAKSDFLAMMSHEIRTPMNAIIGISQIQLQKEGLPYEYTEALEKIYNSGTGLLGIINDILDMSKIESGKLELNPTEYDTASLINDALQLNIVRKGAKPIKLMLEIDEKLPSTMYGDELRIKQILNNLLSNAFKYTEVGYVKLMVRHYLLHGGNVLLKLAVEDTGQGMKKEDKEKLFTEYMRFNAAANRSTEGAGLGLNITKRLVEIMGGAIEVKSEYGEGSTFTVTLKQKAMGLNVIGAEVVRRLCDFSFTGNKEYQDISVSREPMPYGKVLVVDDVETNLYVAKALLRPYKLEIETAMSGFEAIEKIKNGNAYDIIFMDHMMPLMDGIETLKKLREHGYNGMIVALTANALAGNDEMFRQNGFDGFISKPIDVRHLNNILNKFIRDSHPQEAKKYKPIKLSAEPKPEEDSKLLEIFCRTAKKAIVTLRDTSDPKLIATTAHSLKPTLMNLGEKELSRAAQSLEQAGLNGEETNPENFIRELEKLISRLDSAKEVSDDSGIIEDITFLKEQLKIVQTACEDYNAKAALATLDGLKEKAWKSETKTAIEQIHDAIFLLSEFERAGEMCEGLRSKKHEK